jgi:large subunit ribosomal protein L1
VPALKENLLAFIKALQAVRPPSAKGVYIKKVSLSSTMGAGIVVNVEELLRA